MKLSAALIVLVLLAGACEASKLPIFAIYNMRELRSNANQNGKWSVEVPAQPGGSCLFKGPKGLTLNSSKDSQRILRDVAKAQTNAPIITSDDLLENAMLSGAKLPAINLVLTPTAADRFAKFTRSHIGVFLGFFINGRLVSLARVMEPICNGRILVGGIGNQQEAQRVIQNINESRKNKPLPKYQLVKENPIAQTTSLVTPKGKNVTHSLGEFPYVETRSKGFTQVYGTIRGFVQWTKAKSPYVVTDNIYVDRESTLKIDPGVTIKFTKKSGGNMYEGRLSLTVLGRLQAEGTPAQRITFTSASPNPQKAVDWSEIELDSYQPNILTWAVVRYGGSIWVQGCALITHCLVEHCHSAIWIRDRAIAEVRNNVCVNSSYSGIRSQDTSQYCLITDNIFWNNGDGVDSWGSAKAYLNHNLVFGNQNDYYHFAIPGTNDVRANPIFMNTSMSKYGLAPNSPARGAGTDGADIGLCEDKWTPQSALHEKQEFLDNGALELWLKSYYSQYTGAQPISIEYCEEALQKASEPLLKDRIACYLADLYRQNKQPQKAMDLLDPVLKTSKLLHLRDLARSILAQTYIDQKNYEGAVAIMRQTQWPQSKIWVDSEMPRCLASLGKMDEALALLRKSPKLESDEYVSSLVSMVDAAVEARQLEAAIAALAGIEEYPQCPQAVQMRLSVAYALRDAKRYEEALALLKENDSKDPLNCDAPENLFAMAALLEENINKHEESNQVRIRLVTGYYSENQFVKRARDVVSSALTEDKSKLILLDESQGESSIFDRSGRGYCNFGQWIGAQALFAKGFNVHTNGHSPTRTLDLKTMERYGLVIMHGRYGASDNPPMPQDLIENIVTYVENGGVLMVLACGTHLGSGREAQYYNPLMKKLGLSFAEDADLPGSRNPARVLLPGKLSEPISFTPVGGVEVQPGKGTVLASLGVIPVAASAKFGKGWAVAVGSGSGFLDGNLSDTHDADKASKNKSAYVSLVEYAMSLRDADTVH